MTKRQITTTATHKSPLALYFSLLLLSVALFSRGHALNISSVDEFITFTNNVNNANDSFAEETVYLTTDLDFSGYSALFEPIGKLNDTNIFRGTFDGNGYVISNLNVSSDKFRFLGVFGYSSGATIKDLVVDSSCSFESNISNIDNCMIGGIFGFCESIDDECVVDNCVNMASIKYTGKYVRYSYFGGIAGKITPVNYSTSITNCVNYGNVSSVGQSLSQIRIGGITSEVWTEQQISFGNTIKNCVNFGALLQNGGIQNTLYIGGVSGTDNQKLVYENCVSLGAISYNESLGNKASIGSITGRSEEGTLTNCFWDESIRLSATGPISYNVHLQGTVESFNLSSITNPAVLNILESTGNIEFAVLNLDSRGGSAVGPVLVILNSEAMKAIDSLPTPVREESTFDGWYSDTGLSNRFNASELEEGNTTLYAKWIINTYTITFLVDEEEYSKTTQEFGSIIPFPENPTKEGFTFDGWYMDSTFKDKTGNNNMKVSGNTTLYGQFISTTIRIEFSTKDMSTDEVKKEVEKITGCTDCFTIAEVKEDNGKAFIIIKFEDVDKAKNFINAAESTEEFKSKVIVRAIPNEFVSSSLLSLPSVAVLLFVFLFLIP